MKLVRESLEPQHFQRGLDPKEAMGIGKRAMIKAWLDEMEVENYTINDNYTIDVNGSVWINDKNLDKFPDYIQFRIINGVFSCQYNQLTSLRGCPIHVKNMFSCSNNNLISLDGCPKIVGNNFYCHTNAKQFTEEEVRSVCKVKDDIYV